MRKAKAMESEARTMQCRYCGRDIREVDGTWIDPEATGDDAVWRETCDAHDTFAAEHEPGLGAESQAKG